MWWLSGFSLQLRRFPLELSQPASMAKRSPAALGWGSAASLLSKNQNRPRTGSELGSQTA